MTRIPDSIRAWFGADHCELVGSGTVGLSLALRAAGVQGRRVLIPALACPNVAVSVLAAAGVPVMVDMSPDTYDFSLPALEKALDERVAAIIAIDAFGRPADINSIRMLTLPPRCVVVEDACQAYGGRAGNAPLGARGHVGVVSFGYAKPLELMGGGLVITGDDKLAEAMRRLAAQRTYGFIPGVKNRMALKLMRNNDYNTMVGRDLRFGLLKYRFPRGIIRRLEAHFDRWVASLEEVSATIHRARLIIDGLPGVVPFTACGDQWLPWRYSFRVPDRAVRESLLARFTEFSIRTTRLYRPVDEFLDVEVAGDVSAVRALADETVNIVYRTTRGETDQLIDKLVRLEDSIR